MRAASLAVAVAALLGASAAHACNGAAGTVVDAIYPSGARVPDNLLRLYVYFSAPMQEADVLSHVRLTGSDDTPVGGVFLSNRFDLWSPDRTRLTLLLDPGRVKTGLDAHEALGRALNPGETYDLSIDAGLIDDAGCVLREGYQHRFSVTSSDLIAPDPAEWQLELPSAGSRDPLTIDLGSPHDHLSMAFHIRVRDTAGETVRGRVGLMDGESLWQFQPAEAWSSGSYSITIGEEFEDLAGNRPGRLFDQAIGLNLPEPILARPFRPTNP